MKNSSVSNNIIYNMAFQLFTTFIPVIITPYISRTLGLENNSIYSFVETVVTLIAIFGTIGTFLYGSRKVAYVRDNKYNLSKCTYEIIFLKLILLVPILLLYIIFFCITGKYKLYFLISIITIISSSLEITWFFNGLEEFKLITIRNFIIKMCFVISLFLFVKTENDLTNYFWIVVINGFVSNICMYPLLKRYIYPLKEVNKLNVFSHLKESFVLFIPQSANYIYSYSDKIMLGLLTPTLTNVGIYDYAYRIVKMIISLLQSIGYALLSRIANLSSKNDEDGIKKYINLSIKFTLFLSLPMMFGLIGISKVFVPLYLGNEYIETSKVIYYLCPLVLITSLNSVLGVQLLLAVKKDVEYIICTVLGAVINIALNFALIPKYGIIGACITSLLSEFVVLILETFYSYRFLHLKQIAYSFIRYFGCSIVILIICLIVSMFNVSNIIKLVLQVCFSVLFYFLLLYLLKDEMFIKITKKVKMIVQGV